MPPTDERESVVERYLTQRVKELGGLSEKIAPVTAGVPDRLILLPPGEIHLVEVKRVSGKLRPIQEHWIKKARAVGVDVTVVYGREGVDSWLAQQTASANHRSVV